MRLRRSASRGRPSQKVPKGRRSVMKSTIFLALAASPLALVATAMPVAAQDSADQSTANAGMDDIVVTARRREESLQSVPVSITAISSDMLEQKSVQDQIGRASCRERVCQYV